MVACNRDVVIFPERKINGIVDEQEEVFFIVVIVLPVFPYYYCTISERNQIIMARRKSIFDADVVVRLYLKLTSSADNRNYLWIKSRRPR